ncbi:MAG: undecaprenyldiphospho-muramoylpentapeptide beta-N-acetylglucosaminyltransferase [Candidatus Omnitrophota bacterium]
MKVLIASGGSGGHIFPAVSLARELRVGGAELIFVASRRRLDRNILEKEPYKKIFLSANPMPYKFGPRALVFPFKLALDGLSAFFILIKYRPEVVIGFGGYTSGALVLLGAMMKAKTLIHEQNVIPGRTNRFLDKIVEGVAVSFPETGKYFSNRNIVITGNPLRKESLEETRSGALGDFKLDRDRMTILVMGGSQGARSLNTLVSESMVLLSEARKGRLQVIHIAGARKTEEIQKRYDEEGIRGRVYAFIPNINEAYSVSDMAISRSGAAAVFELAAFRKPMILIPYPDEKNNQRFNAIYFAKKNAAIYRDEKTLRPEELRDLISDLIDNANRRRGLSENAGKLSVIDGAKKLAEIVWAIKKST